MPQIEIIEAKPFHCGQMSRILRHEHQDHFGRTGMDIHRELRRSFDSSSWTRAGTIDGKLAGLGGVVGSEISSTGYIWIALSQRATAHPVALVRTMQRLLDEIMGVKRELACVVLPEDTAALRFAVFMGFHTDHTGPGMPAGSRMGRRDLIRYLRDNTDLRMSFGPKGSCIPLGYHRDQHDDHHMMA